MTSHALDGLPATAAANVAASGGHDRHLENMTAYEKFNPVNRCVFPSRTILSNFIPGPDPISGSLAIVIAVILLHLSCISLSFTNAKIDHLSKYAVLFTYYF